MDMAEPPAEPPGSTNPSARHLRLADLAVRVGRRVWAVMPLGARKNIEDRVFFVIFQKTRVENDAYGWRPPEPK